MPDPKRTDPRALFVRYRQTKAREDAWALILEISDTISRASSRWIRQNATWIQHARREQIVEEAVQETLKAVLELAHRPSFDDDPQKSFVGYIRRIARNRTVDVVNTENARFATELPSSLPDGHLSSDPFCCARQQEILDDLKRGLDDRDSEAAELKVMDRLSYSAIAQILNYPSKQAVQRAICHAIQRTGEKFLTKAKD